MTKWGSLDGKRTDISEMDHQHLSNIYWYARVILNSETHPDITTEITKRFNGKVLEYRPKMEFQFEIDQLDSSGYLQWNEDKSYADIFFKNERVGSVTKLSFIRNSKIENLLNGI